MTEIAASPAPGCQGTVKARPSESAIVACAPVTLPAPARAVCASARNEAARVWLSKVEIGACPKYRPRVTRTVVGGVAGGWTAFFACSARVCRFCSVPTEVNTPLTTPEFAVFAAEPEEAVEPAGVCTAAGAWLELLPENPELCAIWSALPPAVSLPAAPVAAPAAGAPADVPLLLLSLRPSSWPSCAPSTPCPTAWGAPGAAPALVVTWEPGRVTVWVCPAAVTVMP